jgi:amino acid transporter
MGAQINIQPSEGPAAHLKRALGVWDLTWLSVVAVANLNVVPVIAAGGSTTMWLWVAAILLFFLPQGLAVIELSHRYPHEGGVYLWTKNMFGDLHGFLCGWCYWTANIFYIPTLVFYLLGIVTYTGGHALGKLGENSIAFGAFAIGLLALAAMANIRGIGVGKWVNNVGGLGTLIAAVLLILLGVFIVIHGGLSIPASSFQLKQIDWPVLSTFGLICFGLVGLELGCVMGDEIRNPRYSVPRGVLYGGILCAVQYVGATLALILAVPQSEVKVFQGVVQGVDKMSTRLGAAWFVVPVAILVGLSTLGALSAWLSGSARILFVSGIDRYLPKVFARVHPRYATPHVALIGIALLSSGLVAMSFAGQTTIKEAYITLLDLAVVLQMISYSYIYASLGRVAFSKTTAPGFYRKGVIRFAAVSGLCTTVLGLIVSFVPSRQVESVWRFEIKMFVSCAVFLGLAVCLFFYFSRVKTGQAMTRAQTEPLEESL